jgi:acetyl esterase
MDAIVNAATGMTLRALPRIPNRVKRLLLGGRSITIDGNTLDTTLQLLLAMQRVAGREGLASSDDVVAARSQLEALIASFKQNINVAAVSDISIPGPAGAIPAGTTAPTQVRPDLVAHKPRSWSSTTVVVSHSVASTPTTINAG